ncbi:16S rRNA (uracil(1498)-N(3))-methyltransferase [bacterium]|nr:16S rRNA (uracil(1498)-N(3))-methyltransferase [bacterium]
MPHFFINSKQIENNKISDKENYSHIAKSLRARVGEKILFIDENQIQYEAKIEQITSSEILAYIEKSYPSKRFLDFDLYLAQSPLRSDAQNLLIEKATELGVAGVYPVKTDNCVLNTEMIDRKIPKWQKIMQEASKQCERANIPVCYPHFTLSELLESEKFDRVLIFCERIAQKTIREITPISKGERILVVIGPEGGFSEKEFEYFRTQNNVELLTLGDLILKADTAVIVGLGNIIYEYSTNK